MLMILKLDQKLRPTSNEGIFNQALIILMNSRWHQIDVLKYQDENLKKVELNS